MCLPRRSTLRRMIEHTYYWSCFCTCCYVANGTSSHTLLRFVYCTLLVLAYLFEGTPVIFQEIICSSWTWPLGWWRDRGEALESSLVLLIRDSLSFPLLWPVCPLTSRLPLLGAHCLLAALRFSKSPSSMHCKPTWPDLWLLFLLIRS